MNKSDAERIASLLDSIGYHEAKSIEESDLVVLVTCSVRQSAEDRVYGIMRQLQKLKSQNPKFKVVLTGCLALQNETVQRLKDVDIFLDIKDLNNLPKLLNKKSNHHLESYFSIKPKYKSSFTAYVPIMTGCNNFCTYCVVPYVRGREESRDPQDIITEVKELISQGYKEIILLGQNVNSYQPPTTNNQQQKDIKDFADLIKVISQLKGEFWLRFVTSHPKDLSDKLIKVIADNKKITEYIHLPIQSGDNTILKKMNRGYTVSQYKNLIKKIRKAIPEAAITTDIIVGFPGETRQQFDNTAKTMQEIGYDMAYIAQYSPRPQTSAAKLKDNVSKPEKKRRENVLTDILKKSALENKKKLINKEVKVLVEKKKGDNWIGKTRGFKVVKFKSDKKLSGKFVTINIVKVESFGLIGKYVK